MVDDSPDHVASLVLATYSKLNFKPPSGQFTILAAFVLRTTDQLKIVSLGTGSKCLPAERLPKAGDALHDSHAEVLARRGAIRWLLEEIARVCPEDADYASPWLTRGADGLFMLHETVQLDMYISTVPCMLSGFLYVVLELTDTRQAETHLRVTSRHSRTPKWRLSRTRSLVLNHLRMRLRQQEDATTTPCTA